MSSDNQSRPASSRPTIQRDEQRAYDALQCDTLQHGGRDFVHQHVVDAWAAQTANADTKPVRLAFALVGLSLHVERGLSGRQVQRVHMALAKRTREWPSFPLPAERGAVTASEVVAAPVGAERDRAIDAWCRSAWEAFAPSHRAVADLLRRHGIS